MDPIIIAGAYALFGDVLATFLAATMAVIVRHRISKTVVGTGLGISAGFILGAAFFDLIAEARQRSHSDLAVAAGIVAGLLLMVVLEKVLERYGLGEEKEESGDKGEAAGNGPPGGDRLRKASIISIGMGIHNIPEALPIGAALVVSPGLSLLVALLMTVETFAESGAITGELIEGNASKARIYGLTMWPSVLSMIGAPIGVILAGISPIFLALTLGLAAGIMLFIVGEVWTDSRKDAGITWSTIGLLLGVILALLTSTAG